MNPIALVVTGFLLVVVGMVLPFLMVLQLLESTFFLNFLAFGCSITGLFLGLVGTANYVKFHRGKE